MQTKNKYIARRLAGISIFLAILIGLVFSSLQVYRDFHQENQSLSQTSQQILNVSERSALIAVETLSENIAQEVLESLLEYDFIFAAKIIDGQGNILAEISRLNHQDTQTKWLTNQVTSQYETYAIDLVSQNQHLFMPGQLSITVDKELALHPFYERALTTIVNGVIRNLLLVILLFSAFHLIITRPLLKMTKAFLGIDPNVHDAEKIAVPHGHEDDEIGQLSNSANLLIDKHKTHIKHIRFTEEKYRAMFESSMIGMVLNDKDGQLIEVNQAYLDIIGYTEEEARQLTYWDLTPKSYDELEQLQLKSLKENRKYGPYEKEYIHKNGHRVPVLLNGVTLTSDDNEPYTWSYIQDISARKLAEEKMKLSSRVFSDTHEGIIITDANVLILDVNPAFCEISGFDRLDVIGQDPKILSSGIQNQQFYKEMWQSIQSDGHWQGEIWNRKKTGELYAQLITISSLKDDNGEVTNYIGVFTDITHSKEQQKKLEVMAHYDVLTNLPNRVLFADRFKQAIAHSKRSHHQLAVCFLDLDNFKPVNDNFGHHIGDLLLIEVAQRITKDLREEDTVSRQGGDEFLILLNDIEGASHCQQTIARIHESIAKPYVIDQFTINITASTGMTIYPSDDGDIDTLIRHADHALYQAKLAGKRQHHLFNPEDALDTAKRHSQIEKITHAFSNDEFCLFYQPKVNMATGNVYGVEALIRWQDPEKGLIPPIKFLPFIENSSLEIKVGDWVIRQALKQIDNWLQQDILLEVSINISSNHLLSSSFIDTLERELLSYPSENAQYLQLEILESSALGDLNSISEIITLCHDKFGIDVALDDFGTGYSSLTHLRSLPASTIKIDQSFVRDLLDDPNDFSIIDGVISLADAFNREIIAEGVETVEHGLMLLVMGCQNAQGYGIAKPMPAQDIRTWLQSYTPVSEWLHCSSHDLTPLQRQQKLFRLAGEQWQSLFLHNIQSPPEAQKKWPIMDERLCHCGTWIEKAQKDHLYNHEFLTELAQSHDQLHQMARAMQAKYKTGHVVSSEEVTEFKALVNKIKLFLTQYDS
jgi:diguanylate cyclase (GGDEF)-like protein/PAS domain S-box-containing protein